MEDKTILQLIDSLKDELDFLPPDDEIRENYLTFIRFMILAS